MKKLYFRIGRVVEGGGLEIGTALCLRTLMEVEIDSLGPADRVFVTFSGDKDGPYEEVT